ncbi:MAG: hypothetical protein IJV39_03120 [Ruminococcus sp.]|nr:hypothetical protein [Ruminococcus sp.]
MTKLRKLTDKIFGGIKMSWLNVIIFAVATAVITTIFLVVPVFKDTYPLTADLSLSDSVL